MSSVTDTLTAEATTPPAAPRVEAGPGQTSEVSETSEVFSTAPQRGGPAEPPVTVIERRPGWQFLDLVELWRFRELLFFLVWRDIKVRYKQTILGAAWAILQPLGMMAALAIFMGGVAGSDKPGAVSYPLFVFAGMLPWTFFLNAITAATSSVVGNQNLVTKIYFPRLLVPLGTVMAALLDFFIAFAMLVVLIPILGKPPGWGVVVLPLVMLILLALAAGLGTLLAALTVTYRDFKAIVPLLLQLWMFATPAIYLQEWGTRFGTHFGAQSAQLLPLNPLHGIVVNFRAAALGGDFDWLALGVSAGWALALLVGGCLYFRRVERGFADVI